MGFDYAYNQKEADKNILLENEPSESASDTAQNGQPILIDTAIVDTVTQNTLKGTAKIAADTLQKPTDYVDIISKKIMIPTDTSLSGIGAVFYFKNLTGQITIAISLLVSLILLVAFKWLKSTNAKRYLLITAVLSLTVFIIDSFISSVTLLWGTWTLLVLLLFQLILEFRGKMKVYR